ncbi:IS110 family transposase [Saccharomonospora sp. CUA-673]|uniref:IS110 family transposase n=1 Tax=Saccharomonospora sp. CUA-673 TaxID=1904969 RepID=UPI0009658826|nr:IS110 family transposase [Saccharomonospora sp. CUA-673]OLT38867.1 IS110 family transposase [Saccharomonospora sp. CUA-673]
MARVSELFDHVVGVDTHAKSNTFALLETRTGAVTATAVFPTSTAGNRRAAQWVLRNGGGSVLAAVEGTSSYGSSITSVLQAEGIDVVEVRPLNHASRAHTGKNDAIDAEAAARHVLGQDVDRLARPRNAGRRSALRVLLSSRSIIDQQRTANRNALTALLRTNELDIDARRPLTDGQIRTIATWRLKATASIDAVTVARGEARRLAKTILEQSALLTENHRQLRELAEEIAPGLQNVQGVGPVTAAIIICAYSHHGRVRSESAFAALAGVAPLPASSGNTTRHRLSRTGDRQLNRAFEVIVRTRVTCDQSTKAYVARRKAEGMSTRDIRRCLKRYVCRSIYREVRTCLT